MRPERYFSDYQEQQIISAIKNAELNTSGEIRLHVERFCETPTAIDRAKEIFEKLQMHKTKDRNGILFYVSYENRKFAIWGDTGIHQKVQQSFWDMIKHEAIADFKNGNLVDGLTKSINKCGLELKKYFPYQSDDINELPDQISY